MTWDAAMDAERPRLLDLYSCAGGAAMGYHRAGFDVVGVDINPQPRYPFEHHVGDALEYLAEHGHEFDAIHASPPCQDHSTLSHFNDAHGTADLLDATIYALEATGMPYIVENVVGARMSNYVVLCGTHFGLSVDDAHLKRHRKFRSNVHITVPGPCSCAGRKIIGVYGTGDGGTGRGWKGSFKQRQAAMGIDWMNREELAQSIPPAYTEWIGRQILAALEPGEQS